MNLAAAIAIVAGVLVASIVFVAWGYVATAIASKRETPEASETEE